MAPIPRLVPWSSWHEWDAVRVLLASPRLSEAQLGVQKVVAWQSRGRVPVAVQITADLISIQLQDPFFGACDVDGASTEGVLRLSYAMAIMRLLNGVADQSQKGRYAQSLADLAAAARLPRLLVDIRHEAAHNDLPSLPLLRTACRQGLDWIHQSYWTPQVKAVADARVALRLALQALPLLCGDGSSKESAATVKQIAALVDASPAETVDLLLEEAVDGVEGASLEARQGALGMLCRQVACFPGFLLRGVVRRVAGMEVAELAEGAEVAEVAEVGRWAERVLVEQEQAQWGGKARKRKADECGPPGDVPQEVLQELLSACVRGAPTSSTLRRVAVRVGKLVRGGEEFEVLLGRLLRVAGGGGGEEEGKRSEVVHCSGGMGREAGEAGEEVGVDRDALLSLLLAEMEGEVEEAGRCVAGLRRRRRDAIRSRASIARGAEEEGDGDGDGDGEVEETSLGWQLSATWQPCEVGGLPHRLNPPARKEGEAGVEAEEEQCEAEEERVGEKVEVEEVKRDGGGGEGGKKGRWDVGCVVQGGQLVPLTGKDIERVRGNIRMLNLPLATM